MSLLNDYTLANVATSYYALAGSGIPIPGPTGPAGPTGATGAAGPSGNSILSGPLPPAAGLGQVGDLYVDFTTSQLYEKTGPATWTPEFSMIGPAGTAATVAVGLTTTLPPGSSANVNNSGTAQNAVFNFAIPAGVTGPQGPTGPAGSAATASLWSTFPAIQDVDVGNHQLDNVTAINAPVGLSVVAATGDITLDLNDPSGNPKVLLQGGALDMDGGDIKNVGSLTAGGVSESATFGQALYPMYAHDVYATNVQINSYNPLSAMNFIGLGGVNINAPSNDINLNAGDINLTQTDGTSIMNLTALGGIVLGAGAAIDLTAGGAVAINAAGTLQILSTGNVSIGSGNVLGADTEVEKFSFKDNEMYRNGSEDLTMSDIKSIEGANAKLELAKSGYTNSFYTQTNASNYVVTMGGGNMVVTGGGFKPAILTDNSASTGTAGQVLTAGAGNQVVWADPQVTQAELDAGLATKLPNNTDISFNHNFAVPIADASGNSPFIYVPAATGPPTGTPAAITGCVPLYVDTTGGLAKLYAYVAGTWVAI